MITDVIAGGAELIGLKDSSYLNWHSREAFMRGDIEITIKPKKEKRWITYNSKTNEGFIYHEPSDKHSKLAEGFQEIEIEVEV